MLNFYLNTKLALDKKLNLQPKDYEDSILMAMGLPYLEANAFDLFNPFTIKYFRKVKKNDWKEGEYEIFLSKMDNYYNSFSNRNPFANPFILFFSLKDDWSIIGKKSAISTLNWLKFEGHRSFFHQVFVWRKELITRNFDVIKDFLQECLENEINIPYFEAYEMNFDEQQLKNSSFYKELEYNLMFSEQYENQMPDCGILAWDMCRFINLVRNCKSTRYITTKEAWEFIRSVKEMCFSNFNSWQEFTLSFKLGRKYWLRGTYSSFNVESFCDELLKDNLKSWNHFHWKKKPLM